MKTPTVHIADQVAEVPVLCIGVERFADVLGLPRTSVYELLRAGKLRTFKHGRRRLAMLDTLREDMQRIAAESAA